MNNSVRILIIAFLMFVTAVVLFYLYISIQWANGMLEIAKEFAKIKTDLEDTIPTFTDTFLEEIKL